MILSLFVAVNIIFILGGDSCDGKRLLIDHQMSRNVMKSLKRTMVD